MLSADGDALQDKDYTEVRVLTMTKKIDDREDLCPTCLISLVPVKLFRRALKMTLSGSQVESIKNALAVRACARPMLGVTGRGVRYCPSS